MSKHRRRLHRSLYKPFQRESSPGDASGLIAPSSDQQMPIVRVITYSNSEYSRNDNLTMDGLPSHLRKDGLIWVDIDGFGDAQTVRRIGELFGLHPLALEDVVNPHQRAKVEEFSDHLFIVSRMVALHDDQLETEQVGMFLGTNFVVTFQERPGDCLDPVRQRLIHSESQVRRRGADYLAYSLLDAIVDGYFPVLEAIGNRLDILEELLVSENSRQVIAQLHCLRSELLTIRRSLWPQREAIAALMRDEHRQVSAETRLYLRDVYDHVVQLLDVTETYREVCADLRDLYYAQLSQRTNDVMRVLTIVSTLFMPLSFIAGLYGMNFDPDASRFNMPELRWYFGYPFAICLMITVAAFMITYFYRRGWLTRSQ